MSIQNGEAYGGERSMGLLSVGRRAGVVCVFKKRTAVRFGLTPSLPSMASSTAAVPVLAEHDDARPCVRVSTLPSPPTDLPSMDRGSTQSFLHAIPPLSVGWRAARSMGCSRACCAGAPVPSVRANAQFIHCAIGRNSFHLHKTFPLFRPSLPCMQKVLIQT